MNCWMLKSVVISVIQLCTRSVLHLRLSVTSRDHRDAREIRKKRRAYRARGADVYSCNTVGVCTCVWRGYHGKDGGSRADTRLCCSLGERQKLRDPPKSEPFINNKYWNDYTFRFNSIFITENLSNRPKLTFHNSGLSRFAFSNTHAAKTMSSHATSKDNDNRSGKNDFG